MELSVVRIHKASLPGGQPWLNARLVVHPDKYLSQCPFILLNEESHEPHSEFPVRSHKGVITVTLVLGGSAHQTDGTGGHWQLAHGDADFSIGSGGVLQGTTSDSGVQLLHLWINLPAALKTASARHEVVRSGEACRATLGDASALLYAGTLGATCGPYTGPWPLTVADLSLQAGKATKLPLASNERSFVYVLRGNVELGRNRVRLGRDSIAWIERTVGPEGINSLSARAAKETRLLLFSSPVFGEDSAAAGGNSANCASDLADSVASESADEPGAKTAAPRLMTDEAST